jgi:hypothetical protein
MAAFVCPMHRDLRVPDAGSCPKCGMPLVDDGERFALIKHLAANRLMLAIMVAVMLAVMAAVMMLLR